MLIFHHLNVNFTHLHVENGCLKHPQIGNIGLSLPKLQPLLFECVMIHNFAPINKILSRISPRDPHIVTALPYKH